MSFYGGNVNAKLFMGASTAASLPAPGADSFTEVPLLGSITPPANVLSSAFFNVLNTAAKKSVGGTLGDQTVPGNIVLDWTEAVHTSMYADSKVSGGQKRNWYMEYPDENNRRLDFVAFLSSWIETAFDAGEEVVEHRSDFILTVDGAVTVTA